jgi:hypothetical protein
MSSSELMAWTAFERIHGPLLVHERLDIGLAELSYYLVSIFSRKRTRLRFEKFLPPYMREAIHRQPSDPDKLRSIFEGLVDANDRNPDGRHPE